MGDIQRVGIVGSGIMGAGLAEVVAKAGFDVIVRSRSRAGAAAVVDRVTASLERQVAKGRLEADDRDATAGPPRSPPTTSVASATATSSSRAWSRTWPPSASCSPSSSRSSSPTGSSPPTPRPCPVIELAMATERPDRVCGIHFFNPAPMMKLVEVVRPITASDDTIKAATSVRHDVRQGRHRGRRPSRVRRQRAALPVPQQRRADAGARHGLAGGHRHRHAGRLQLPDGSAGAARPRRTRHVAVHPRRPVRRVPRPELRSPSRRCGGWWPPATSVARRAKGFYRY